MNSEDIIVSVSSNTANRVIPDTDRFKPSHRKVMLPNEGKSDTSSKQASASHAGETLLLPLSARMIQMLNSMRNTLEVKDHEHGAKMYSTCFTAACVIDWLLINGFVDSRSEGIHICQELLDSQMIVALTNIGNDFQDTDDLYAFKSDLQVPRAPASSEVATWLFAPHVKSNSVILSIPKASLLEAAINSHDVKQLTPLLTELRQQTFYHLLYREGGEWKERKRIDRHGNYIFVERPMSQQGNYSILRSTREISGDAEEVYRDLLIGDMSGPQIRGRARWEKRLSREEVLCTIEGVNNEERIPFVRRLFKNRNNSTFNDGASVILKEWKKMGGVYKGCRTYNDIPQGVRVVHRYMKSGSGFATCRDLVLLQDHFRTEEGCYVIYEVSVNGELPSQRTAKTPSYVRAEVLLCAYLLIPSGRDKCRLSMFCQYNDYQSLLLMLLKTRPLITCDVTGFRHVPLGEHPMSADSPSSNSITVENETVEPAVEPSVEEPVVPAVPSHGEIHLEDFKVLALLGRGGYGKVLHVLCTKTNQYFAMKVLKKDEIVRRRQVARTKVERLILERANFPFITRLYYAYQTPYRLYMVIDYMQCGDLFTHLSRFGVFTEDRARIYIAEIVLALEHLHNMGIIYRDLKPENVLLGADGHIKLTDFGLSRYYSLRGELKRPISELRSYSYCGTEQYMAPEMLLRRPHTEAIDWWSLGILLCECLTGCHPFQGHSHHQTLNNIMNTAIAPRIRSVSMDARSLILRLLERDPQRRLGCTELGVQGIKCHPFFATIDWDALLKKKVALPYTPRLSGPADYTYFDRMIPGSILTDSVSSPQRPPSEMELQLRIRQEKERQLVDNPHGHERTRTPSSELDTRYIGFEYSCD